MFLFFPKMSLSAMREMRPREATELPRSARNDYRQRELELHCICLAWISGIWCVYIKVYTYFYMSIDKKLDKKEERKEKIWKPMIRGQLKFLHANQIIKNLPYFDWTSTNTLTKRPFVFVCLQIKTMSSVCFYSFFLSR